MTSRSGWTARRVLRACALALLVTAYAGLTPVLAGRVSGSLLTLALGVAGAVLSFVAEWRRGGDGWRSLDAGRMVAGGAGALSLFLAPYLVLTNRSTGAPSGTELIFLTTSAWGLFAAIGASAVLWRAREHRRAFRPAAGAFAALVGSAGILANWERPSSFSPFVRFVAQETWMLVAGIAFVAGALLLARAKKDGVSFPFLTAAVSATALSAIAWLLSGDGLSTLALPGTWPMVALWAAIGGMTWFMWNRESAADGLLVPAATLFAPPLLLPLLSSLESAAGIPGVNPLVWSGVGGGALVVVAGVARMLFRQRSSEEAVSRDLLADRWSRGLAVFAGAMVALAGAGMALPALRAVVTGVRDGQDLDISWTMLGWESVAAWTALALGVLLLSTALDGAWPAALAALAATPAYWLLARTPTHVWIRSLSAEIQQDYGTEYANITFAALPSWPARAAVVGVAAGLVAVSIRRGLVSRRKGAEAPGIPLEEQQ